MTAKRSRMRGTRWLSLLPCLALLSCVAPVPSLPTTPQDNTAALIKDPQFPAMARAAPELTRRMLETITRLETEKANHTP